MTVQKTTASSKRPLRKREARLDLQDESPRFQAFAHPPAPRSSSLRTLQEAPRLPSVPMCRAVGSCEQVGPEPARCPQTASSHSGPAGPTPSHRRGHDPVSYALEGSSQQVLSQCLKKEEERSGGPWGRARGASERTSAPPDWPSPWPGHAGAGHVKMLSLRTKGAVWSRPGASAKV